MKISEMGFSWWVLFVTETNAIEHSVGFETLPNVASLAHVLEEIKTDKEFSFSCDPELLRVALVRTEEYLEIMGDIEVTKSETSD